MIPYFHIQDIPYFLQIGGHFSCCVNASSSQLPISFSCNLLSPHSHQFLSPDFIACLHRRRNLQWPINLPSHTLYRMWEETGASGKGGGRGDPTSLQRECASSAWYLKPKQNSLVAGAVRQQLFQPHHSACLPQLPFES